MKSSSPSRLSGQPTPKPTVAMDLKRKKLAPRHSIASVGQQVCGLAMICKLCFQLDYRILCLTLARPRYREILTLLKACSVSTVLDLLIESDSIPEAGRDVNVKVTATVNQQCTYILPNVKKNRVYILDQSSPMLRKQPK
jgi:hypothetical protein